MADDIVTRLRDYVCLGGYECLCDSCVLLLEAAAEIERLRRLGDTLAYHVRAEEAKEMYSAVHAWEEARRG